MFIEGNRHSVAGAAQCDAQVNLPALDGEGKRMRNIRIVHALGAVGTEIHHLISLFLQSLDYRRLVFHARVVAAYSYSHDIQSFLKIP